MVTRTTAAPALPAGVVAVICVSLPTVNPALLPAKVTPVAPMKLAPTIVTALPPAVVPRIGLTEVTMGGVAIVKVEMPLVLETLPAASRAVAATVCAVRVRTPVV